jgi:hypothetical protein
MLLYPFPEWRSGANRIARQPVAVQHEHNWELPRHGQGLIAALQQFFSATFSALVNERLNAREL